MRNIWGLLGHSDGTAVPLALASVSPNYGSTGATRSVVITKSAGPSFTGSETVTIGSACTVTGHTSNTLTVTVPAGISRAFHDVVVNGATLASSYFAINAVFWFDAARGVTLSGSNVTSVADQGGTTSVASTWAASASNPTFNASSAKFNGRPSVSFNGGDQFLDAGNCTPFGTSGSGSGSICSSAECSTTNSNPNATIVGLSYNSFYFQLGLDPGGTGELAWYTSTSTKSGSTNATVKDNTAHGYVTVHDNSLGSGNTYINMDSVVQTTKGNDTSGFTTTTDHLSIGRQIDATGLGSFGVSWSGEISEVFGEAVAFSGPEQAFLMAKSTVGSFANLNGVGA